VADQPPTTTAAHSCLVITAPPYDRPPGTERAGAEPPQAGGQARMTRRPSAPAVPTASRSSLLFIPACITGLAASSVRKSRYPGAPLCWRGW